ncbi:MAG: purine-binding chemotaxis protein CheW [Deltaproteobacteria bacterium]|nr:purine-binding chemotaxis protein CheW [Candidatus Tharpella aukensis]
MADTTLQLCSFQLADALFGLDTMLVQEIIKVPEITKVYQAPEEIIGIINLRGKIVTIIDLAIKLDLPTEIETNNRRIIIVESHNEPFGLMVDTIHDVIHIDGDELGPAPANVRISQGRFISGVFRDEEQLIAILNIEEIVSLAESKTDQV